MVREYEKSGLAGAVRPTIAEEPPCLIPGRNVQQKPQPTAPRPEPSLEFLVTGDRNPTAIYTAVREVELMAGRSVVAQLGAQIETLGARMETQFDSINRQLRLIWTFLFTLLAMMVTLLLRT